MDKAVQDPVWGEDRGQEKGTRAGEGGMGETLLMMPGTVGETRQACETSVADTEETSTSTAAGTGIAQEARVREGWVCW